MDIAFRRVSLQYTVVKETWLDINGFEGSYQISNLGRVKSLPKIKPIPWLKNTSFVTKTNILKPHLTIWGYWFVSLRKNKRYFNKTIHRLVMEHFVPNPKKLPQVNHKNGIKADNRIKNLEWVTASQNRKHSVDLGLEPRLVGNKSRNHKLTEGKVRKIRKLYIPRIYSQYRLAMEFGVSRSNIEDIVHFRYWNG